MLWVVAEDDSAFQAAYLSIARELGLVETQPDLETAVHAVTRWLACETGWLLVFDNADDPSVARAYLPSARTGGKVLLTSRAKSFADVGVSEPIHVETMDPTEATAFLLKRTKRDENETAAELSRELGYLPLALEQAAAYIDTVSVSISAYLASFKQRGLQLLESGKAGADYPASVATTWNLSFARIRKASPASAELLIAAAFLVPDFVPIETFVFGGIGFGSRATKRSSWGKLLDRFRFYQGRPKVVGDALRKALEDSHADELYFWELSSL